MNGKLRSRVLASPDVTEDELRAAAVADEKVRPFTRSRSRKNDCGAAAAREYSCALAIEDVEFRIGTANRVRPGQSVGWRESLRLNPEALHKTEFAIRNSSESDYVLRVKLLAALQLVRIRQRV